MASEEFPSLSDANGSATEPEMELEVKPGRSKRRSVAGRRKKRRGQIYRNSWSQWGEEVHEESFDAFGNLVAIWEESLDAAPMEQMRSATSPKLERSRAKSHIGVDCPLKRGKAMSQLGGDFSYAAGPYAPMSQKFQRQLHCVSDELSRLLLALQPQVVATQQLEVELCTLQAQIEHLCECSGEAVFDVCRVPPTGSDSAAVARDAIPSRPIERCRLDLDKLSMPVNRRTTVQSTATFGFATQMAAGPRNHNSDEGPRNHNSREEKHPSMFEEQTWQGRFFKKAGGDSTFGRQPLLPDTDGMKRAVREAASKKSYNVKAMYYSHGLCQRIARSEAFDFITTIFILASSVWIAVEADYNNAELLLEASPLFIVVENMFCAFFTFEWLIRFGAFRRKTSAFSDRWFCFDGLLLAFMIFDTWLLLLLTLLSGDWFRNGLSDASLLRFVRLLRLCRVARLIKILSAMPELMVLFKGLSVAFRAVVATLGLLAVVIYIFSILFRQLARGTELEARFFSSVPNSMGMLLLASVTPDLIDFYTNDFIKDYFYLGALFFCFILLVTFTVLNLLVGVLVNVVSVVAKMEQEEVQVISLKKQIVNMFDQLDQDRDCMVSRDEFNTLLVRPELCSALSEAGVDCVGLVDVAQYIFDQHDGEVEVGTLLDLVLQLRGTNVATVKDIVDFRRLLSQDFLKLEDRIVSFARAVAVAARQQKPQSCNDGLSMPVRQSSVLTVQHEPHP
eukprot:CAMPEP_0115600726 /NCGR_PEP_ID=MMETSP0272-20121206/15036_1 /TAXON_ID=71861 /ORGANISM="Scrippsiella trochoidea, Strain CCMP3099" /LENGTH=732 /DNA_ID=CAMNT_0003036177 /DNA_START=118 /DNA_END=2316 /DNA_ORIENTATION=+